MSSTISMFLGVIAGALIASGNFLSDHHVGDGLVTAGIGVILITLLGTLRDPTL